MSKRPITDKLLNQLLANYRKPEDLIGAEGILKQLTKNLHQPTPSGTEIAH
jgi:putative transposase